MTYPCRPTTANRTRYNHRVFFAPFWEAIFEQDAERKQTRAEAEATCAVMHETYTAPRYEITELPFTYIRTRADFACKQLSI